MKGVIKQNRHIATASTITKTNVNEDKVVSSRTCVKNVRARIIDKYAQESNNQGICPNQIPPVKQFRKPVTRNTNYIQTQR
jgi:hypothetical protein